MLSERLRANCECAPWVIEEVKKLESKQAVAEAAVKDVKRSTLLEVIQLLNQSPYSLTKRECIDLVTALKMKVDNNEN